MSIHIHKGCHIHTGQEVLAYCIAKDCHSSPGKCQICLNYLTEYNCNFSHIINASQLDIHLINIKADRIKEAEHLRKVNNHKIQIVQQVINCFEALKSGIMKNNENINNSIDEIKTINKDNIFNNSSDSGKLGLKYIDIINDKHIQIKKDILTQNVNYDQHNKYFQELMNCHEKYSKYTEMITQNLFENKSIKINNLGIFENNVNIYEIMQSIGKIEELITQKNNTESSRIDTYPDFIKQYNEVIQEIEKKNVDKAFQKCIQIRTIYIDNSYFLSLILELISNHLLQLVNTLGIQKVYLMKYQHMLDSDFSLSQKIDRILSEYSYDEKNLPASLNYLQNIKTKLNNPIKYNYSQYYIDIRKAQIYYKMKKVDMLTQQYEIITNKIKSDPFVHYLAAKIQQLKKKDKNVIIKEYELSISKKNSHPMFFRKYSKYMLYLVKYLLSVGDCQNAKRIYQEFQSRKFIIGNYHDKDINCLNYIVNLN